MDVRSLRAFVEIAEAGGFNRAATNLHVAQSALSRRIGRLEDEIGTPLLIRTKRGVRLTPAGALLLDKSGALLRHFEQVEAEILAEANEPRGELSIGLPPSLHIYSTELLAALRQKYPRMFVRTWVATSVDLRTLLLSGKLDLAVYASSEEDTLIAVTPLFMEPLRLLGRSGSLAAGLSSWEAIGNLPLMLTSRPNSVRLAVESAAARHRCRLDVILEVNDVPLLTHLVRKGVGYSILPASALHGMAPEEIDSAELPGAGLSWVVAHSRERPLSTAAKKAIEEIALIMSS
jgi:LysR family transcriptional regulator, nitrogen assimilation regulatory protein